jgi:hypothetical protein
MYLPGDGDVKLVKKFAADGTEFMIEEGIAKAFDRVSPTLGSKLQALVAGIRTIERTRPGEKCIGACAHPSRVAHVFLWPGPAKASACRGCSHAR